MFAEGSGRMEEGGASLLGGGKDAKSARWSPYGAASAAGKAHVALGIPILVVVVEALFLYSQLAPLWAAHGGMELTFMSKEPSRQESVMTYNLPSTVKELFKAKEHLLGEDGRRLHERDDGGRLGCFLCATPLT